MKSKQRRKTSLFIYLLIWSRRQSYIQTMFSYYIFKWEYFIITIHLGKYCYSRHTHTQIIVLYRYYAAASTNFFQIYWSCRCLNSPDNTIFQWWNKDSTKNIIYTNLYCVIMQKMYPVPSFSFFIVFFFFKRHCC